MLWTVTGIVVLVFACGKRYQGNGVQLKAEGVANNCTEVHSICRRTGDKMINRQRCGITILFYSISLSKLRINQFFLLLDE
jgi:hypothetical protein